MKKRLVTIVGARPQFIKAAVLSRLFQQSLKIENILVHTGQHFDTNMSDVFFKELDIPAPSYTLDIQGGPHGQMTGRMLEKIEKVLMDEKPDAVLVYGDTNSTLAGALAAAKLHIPIIHLEAGLRSYNQKMPEEINRVLTDHLSSVLLCPTKTSVDNLNKEGLTKNIYHTGDIMYDAAVYALAYLKQHSDIAQKLDFLPEHFIFMTVHRAESTDSIDEFKKMLLFAEQFVQQLSDFPNLKIIFPVHPRTKKILDQEKIILKDFFMVLEPLSYFETQYCLSKAQYVLTDSGGLQKEAYFHRVPCITLRQETEWVETITHGWNRLWTTSYYAPRCDIDDYGHGKSAEDILNIILQIL